MINVGTLVSAAVRPNDTLDLIASAYADEIKGGLHSATSSVMRNLIINERRSWGMLCYVEDEDKTYQLIYTGITASISDNSNWVEFTGGGIGIKYLIESTDVITVPAYYQYFVYGDLTIQGELINYGQVVIGSGGMILSGGSYVQLGTGSLIFTDFDGPIGPTGIQGPTGPGVGAQGVTGPQGYQGRQGSQGTQGFQGIQGTQGTQGYQGAQGYQGIQGTQGYQGATGPQGLDGGNAGKIYYLAPSLSSDISTYKQALAYPSPYGETVSHVNITGVGDNLMNVFATNPNDPSVTDFPYGTAFRHFHVSTGASNAVAKLKIELYTCSATGSNETLIRSGYSNDFSGTTPQEMVWSYTATQSIAMSVTDRVIMKVYAVKVSGPTNIDVYVYYEGTDRASFIQTTISAGAVGPQGFQGATGSVLRVFSVQVIDATNTLTIGDGKVRFRIDSTMNLMNLTEVGISVATPSTSGTPSVQISRGRQTGPTSSPSWVDMLSTNVTIDVGEFDSKDSAIAYVINTSNDDVATGDIIRIDVDSAGTGTLGLNTTLRFQSV